ncbi:hypothetical protein [Thermococcus sp.]
MDSLPPNGKLTVNLTGAGKDCYTATFVEGESKCKVDKDKECTYNIDNWENATIRITASCKKEKVPESATLVLTFQPTSNGKADGTPVGIPETAVIIIKPLTVSFPRLVSALTCSEFSINDETAFRTQVAKTVLAAALSDKKPCSVISNTNGGTGNDIPDLGGYNWQVIGENGRLVLRAAKGEKVDDTTELFRIEFKGKDMGVWVKDAESYQGKDKIMDLASSIIQQREYANYCINFDGRDYYANCKAYSKNIVGDIPTMVASYSAGCIVGTIGCAVGLTSLSAGTLSGMGLKDAAASAITCTIAPIITAITWKITSATETSKKYWISETPLAFGGLLPSKLALSATATRLSAKRMATLEKELEMLKNVKTVLNQGAVSEVGTGIKNYANNLYALAQEASKAGAKDIMDEPLYKVLGYKSATDAAKELAGKSTAPPTLKEFLENTKLSQYTGPEASDDFAKAFMDAVKKSGADPDAVAKNLANRYDEVTKVVEEKLKPKLSLKKQLLCGAVGAALGTTSYYLWASHEGATGLRYNKLSVTVDSPLQDVVKINITGASTLHNNGVIEVTPQ